MASKFHQIISDYKVIICDECHYIKSPKSKRTMNLMPILQQSSRLIMISGTPALSRPLELYTVLTALDKNMFTSFFEYGLRYCDAHKVGQFYNYKGCSNAEELNFILQKGMMIRRTKNLVLSQLPAKSRRQVILSIPKQKGIISQNIKFVGENVVSDVMAHYNNTAVLKKKPVEEYLENMIEKGIKFIVFAHHQEMMSHIEEFFERKKQNFIKIDGTTLSSKRFTLIDSFQNDPTIKIALLSLTACCTGLTLTAGTAVVFAELYWNPGTMLQAEDRIHRIGQKSNVDIHYLVCKNTIDEFVWPKLLSKLNVLEKLGIGKNELNEVGEIDYKQETRDKNM